jgi:hypothetical protein
MKHYKMQQVLTDPLTRQIIARGKIFTCSPDVAVSYFTQDPFSFVVLDRECEVPDDPRPRQNPGVKWTAEPGMESMLEAKIAGKPMIAPGITEWEKIGTSSPVRIKRMDKE